ncbi:hypothetical protein HXZ66_15790 [Bacillus sp. A116_S68]|jgi:7-cyano-7-deazaguanine synthase in queuosine biosynthesis|nr:hypothetical protein HXZ66_15790 [Bacillus sp. A116_S68]
MSELNKDFLSTIHVELLESLHLSYEKDSKIIDLVTIMSSIYCADIHYEKIENNPRYISLTIPVFNENDWVDSLNDIADLVYWMSGDYINIEFIHNYYSPSSLKLPLGYDFKNEVTLFSGGLDSLTGAFYNYKNNIMSDYVGFINKPEEGNHQQNVGNFYKQIFKRAEVILVKKPNLYKNTLTQYTRSLLYLSLAIAKAVENNSKIVRLYENGILSLNPELEGRITTKTTHPKTLYLLNKILSKQDINVDILHPFLYSTKGERTKEMEESFLLTIKDTFTCGTGRSPLRNHKGQCGVCIPCLLRKISLASYDLEKYDVTYHYNYDTKLKDIDQKNYYNEFKSNINYFIEYNRLIKEDMIFVEIDTNIKYYKDKDYRKKIYRMLETFSIEFERFINKYDPN